MSETYEQFSEWYSKFITKHGGYQPCFLKQWWNECNISHDNLRKILGGVRKEVDISLEAGQNKIPIEELKQVTDKLIQTVPEFFRNTGWTEETLRLPIIQDGTHNAHKVSKTLTASLNGLKKGTPQHQAMQEFINTLGTLWARHRTNKIDFHVNMSTSPRAFVLLGHYDADADSCFRQNSERTNNKYMLAQTHDSFVLLLTRKNHKDIDRTVARLFGIFDPDKNVFHFSNYYAMPGINEGDVIHTISTFLELITGHKYESIEESLVTFDKSIYHNPYGRWSFRRNNSEPTAYRVIVNQNGVSSFTCFKCGYRDSYSDRYRIVDDSICCSECTSKANSCDLTGQKTYKELIQYCDNNGNIYMVHPDVAKEFKSCPNCECKCYDTKEENGIVFCLNCADEFNTCDMCGRIHIDSDLTDIGDSVVCNACIRSGNLPIDEILNIESFYAQ